MTHALMKRHVLVQQFQTLDKKHIYILGHKVSGEVITDLTKMLVLHNHMFWTTIFKHLKQLEI